VTRSGWRVAAPIALAASGMLFVVSARAAGGEDLRAGHSELADLVRAEERRALELGDRLEDLQVEVDELSANEETTATGALERVAEVRPAAGLTPVEGPGLTVTLDDAPLPADGTALPEGTSYDDYVVHQQDVEGVVNSLWAGGAEAMEIMDQRIVSTSAVRCVGNVLILHGQVYSPPFTIAAIGDVDAMSEALDESPAVSNYRAWAEEIGLGWDVDVADELRLPAYTGPVDISAVAP
jgi:uncharacterized protein YlxW (UPF0749 family)